MAPFTDTSRLRAEAAASPRLSIARRALLDLPAAAAGSGSSAGSSGAGGEAPARDGHPDFDLGANFDVPAFLRRQEG
jgi:hypothetical protein